MGYLFLNKVRKEELNCCGFVGFAAVLTDGGCSGSLLKNIIINTHDTDNSNYNENSQ